MSLLIITLQNCKDDDEPEQVNITGSWEMIRTIGMNDCGIPTGTESSEILYLTDSNGIFTITNFNGVWGNGQVTGSNMIFVGSETSDDFGCEATLTTDGEGIITDDEITGDFVTNVSFDESCGSLTECTFNADYVLTKLEETSCYDRAVFDDPAESDYILPFPVGFSYPVYQSYCWRTGGHRDQLAYDFTMPIGDTVIAIRGGMVRSYREDSPDNGEGVGQHNYIFIQHEDGTTAFYAHLMQNSVVVDVDETVMAGQFIALSGNSGYSGEPHLHIGVYQEYPTTEGEDVPFNFRNADGPLDERNGLIRGETYTALP